MGGVMGQIGWRLAQAALVAIMVGILSFMMMAALPGDMSYRIAGARYGYDAVDASAVAAVGAELGDPAEIGAFLTWMGQLLTGDLGNSLVSGAPVSGEIAHQLGATAQLSGLAVILSLLIGPPLGVAAGMRARGVLDRTTLVAASTFKAVPQFLLALLLIVVVSIEMGVLPSAGHGEARHIVLPALTLALGLAATTARVTREAVVQIRGSDWWRFARWKGLSEGQILRRHGLRHLAVPLVTLIAAQFVVLLEGVVVVETIFGWPGIGHALIHAVFHRDVPMVQGTALVMGLGFVLINALADVVARTLDPREAAR